MKAIFVCFLLSEISTKGNVPSRQGLGKNNGGDLLNVDLLLYITLTPDYETSEHDLWLKTVCRHHLFIYTGYITLTKSKQCYLPCRQVFTLQKSDDFLAYFILLYKVHIVKVKEHYNDIKQYKMKVRNIYYIKFIKIKRKKTLPLGEIINTFLPFRKMGN